MVDSDNTVFDEWFGVYIYTFVYIYIYSKCSPLIRIITIDSEFNTLNVLILIVIYH